MSILGGATTVLLRVCAKYFLPSSPFTRILRRLACASPKLEQLPTSKYFEVGSCSNLGDAQARRLKIRVKGEDGKKYFAHTLNNTVVAPPRMLIAFLENNLNEDGTIRIPEALRPYMGGMEVIK